MPSEEFAAKWGMTPQGLQKAASRGELPSIKVSNRTYYPAVLCDLPRPFATRLGQAMRSLSPGQQVIFLLRRHGALDGKSIGELTTSAQQARALELAQRYNRVLRDDPTAGFEGYQLADPASEESLCGVDRQVEALWATLLHDWQLGYINPPPAYSGTLDSQRLRMPSMIREHRAGTCIDLALLFAACLELIDIYPVIFLLEGHALPGWWRHASFRDEYADMSKRTYSDVIHATATENSAASAQVVEWQTGKSSWNEVRRWIRERKLVPIETVRLTEHCSFVEAIEAGVDALAEQRDFDSMLDIVTARLKQVTPLPMLKEAP